MSNVVSKCSEIFASKYIVGSEPERIISLAAKMEKIEKQSLQHAVNSARRATETVKHS